MVNEFVTHLGDFAPRDCCMLAAKLFAHPLCGFSQYENLLLNGRLCFAVSEEFLQTHGSNELNDTP